MASRCPLLLVCALLFCAAVSADESADVKKDVKKKVNKDVTAADVAVVEVQVVQQATAAQQAAAKKLAEAEKAAKQATEELAEAEKQLAAAQGEEAKEVASKRVEKAKSQLEEAQKNVAKQRVEVRRAAAAQAVFVRGGFPWGGSLAVRKEVDINDAVERFVLLTPAGPLVVEANMTIDGKPFRQPREKLIDEMLATADTDKDGKPTWEEALKNPRFTLGRVRVLNDQQRDQYLKGLDKNQDGLVDRYEARLFVAQFSGGPAFTISGGYGYQGGFGGAVVVVNGQSTFVGGGQADVKTLLDTDKDGGLSQEEIAAAGERLKSHDADDNDLLYPQELAGSPGATNNQQLRVSSRQFQAPQQLAMLLGPTGEAEPLFQALQAHYKNAEGEIVAGCFPAFPQLFKQLDKNVDGKLAQDEVLTLNQVEPHVRLSIDLGKDAVVPWLTVKHLSPELTKADASGKEVAITMPGVKLSLAANLNPARAFDYSATAKSLLDRYDNDDNGYLDKEELAGNLAQQMELWDEDADGKVYAKEITASYTRMMAPQMSQIRANVSSGGDSLFQTLDLSGDGRLSLREMKTAHAQIKTFDKDNDNCIAPDEIPAALSVTVGLGTAGYGVVVRSAPGARPGDAEKATPSDVPEWFTRMDRNGDGDVTLKEFLGDEQAFKKLDTNGDGFIEPKEAQAADKAK